MRSTYLLLVMQICLISISFGQEYYFITIGSSTAWSKQQAGPRPSNQS
jgi:hypothetical protein